MDTPNTVTQSKREKLQSLLSQKINLFFKNTNGQGTVITTGSLKIENNILIPDVMVICHNNNQPTDQPTVVIEMLPTESHFGDFVCKFKHYQKIDALREYLVIHQDEPLIFMFRKQDDGKFSVHSLEQMIHLESIDFSISVEEIYQNINHQLTIDEFFAYLDNNPDTKAELIDGQIITRTGNIVNHSIITMNLLSNIDVFLQENKPDCNIYSSDFAIQTKAKNVRFPDFSISCHLKGSDRISKTPIVIGEVLSETDTAMLDEIAKLEEYQNVHSVQEIFLIAQTQKEVTVYRRGKFFGWETETYTNGLVEFQSIGYALPIDDIYHRVMFAV